MLWLWLDLIREKYAESDDCYIDGESRSFPTTVGEVSDEAAMARIKEEDWEVIEVSQHRNATSEP